MLSGAQHLASSGRTSFPVDKALPRDAYRVLGYRQCGERAVRVDILERLADLIRPALAWRETSPGEKPAGAFDGRGFVVTQAMTSLTGSAGEDFASILRALGYRMERRPPLPPKPVVVETVAAERRRWRLQACSQRCRGGSASRSCDRAPAEAATDAPSRHAAEIVDQPVSGDPAPSAALLPEVSPLSERRDACCRRSAAGAGRRSRSRPAVEAAEAAPARLLAEAALPKRQTEAAPASDAAPAEAAAGNARRAAARRSLAARRPPEERRPRHERQPPSPPSRPAAGRRAGGRKAKARSRPEAGEGEKRERHRRHGRRKDFRKPREGAPAEAAAAARRSRRRRACARSSDHEQPAIAASASKARARTAIATTSARSSATARAIAATSATGATAIAGPRQGT